MIWLGGMPLATVLRKHADAGAGGDVEPAADTRGRVRDGLATMTTVHLLPLSGLRGGTERDKGTIEVRRVGLRAWENRNQASVRAVRLADDRLALGHRAGLDDPLQ